MKTNVTMNSVESRELYGVTIRQETKNSFLSLKDLQEAYTHARVQFNWKDKRVSDILNYEENIERIFYLLQEQDLLGDKSDLTRFYESVKEKGMTKVLKELGVYKTTGRGENKSFSCNPYIWVLVAMELNPKFYAKVVTWLTDKLIINRIEACDLNKNLRSAYGKFGNPDYGELNKALNIKVFGYHETGMRNLASEKDLRTLCYLQDSLCFCIKQGYLKSKEEVFKAIEDYEVEV